MPIREHSSPIYYVGIRDCKPFLITLDGILAYRVYHALQDQGYSRVELIGPPLFGQ